MGIFKKKNKGKSSKDGQEKGMLSSYFENEVMEKACNFTIDQAKLLNNTDVQGYVEDARKHYLNDCMDMDDVEVMILCLQRYNEAITEMVVDGKADEGMVLASVYAMSLLEKMEEKRKKMM